jgi:hypothetical protein
MISQIFNNDIAFSMQSGAAIERTTPHVPELICLWVQVLLQLTLIITLPT